MEESVSVLLILNDLMSGLSITCGNLWKTFRCFTEATGHRNPSGEREEVHDTDKHIDALLWAQDLPQHRWTFTRHAVEGMSERRQDVSPHFSKRREASCTS